MKRSDVISAVREYMLAHRAEMVRDLKRLVRIPSIRSEARDGAPFGRECARALLEAIALFRENGFAASASPSNAYGIATYGEGEPTVALFGHTDVVPVGDDWMLTAPFDPIELDGYLIGRGVEDNKAGVVISLYVMRAFRDLSLPLNGRLLAFLGSAEETGMEDIEAFVREHPMPRVSIVPDNAYPISFGEKGICQIRVRAERPFSSVVSLTGGTAFNVILDRATVGLCSTEALKKELKSKIGGSSALSLVEQEDTLLLTAVGLTAHAATPDGSVNAALLLAECLAETEALDGGDRAIFASLRALLSSIHGEALGIACSDPRFGAVSSANGIVGLDGAHLSFTLDIRYGTALDSDEMYRSVERALEAHGFRIACCTENKKPFAVSADSSAARALLGVYREVSGELDAEPFYSSGGTYARYLENAFSVGCAVPYISGNKKLPEGHGGAHQSDEYIYIDSLVESAAMITLMVDAAFREPKGKA